HAPERVTHDRQLPRADSGKVARSSQTPRTKHQLRNSTTDNHLEDITEPIGQVDPRYVEAHGPPRNIGGPCRGRAGASAHRFSHVSLKPGRYPRSVPPPPRRGGRSDHPPRWAAPRPPVDRRRARRRPRPTRGANEARTTTEDGCRSAAGCRRHKE